MNVAGQAAGLTPDEAELPVGATLETLGERISRGEADDVAAFLPRELRPLLTQAPPPAEPFGLFEFVGRVAEREGVDGDAAAEHARATFEAIGFAVAPGELRDMISQLPRAFDELLERARVGQRLAMADDDFVLRVARRADLDPDHARRATESVLETLAERLSAGEVEDLVLELPGQVRPALRRGLEASRSAEHMTADDFLTLVAEREGVSGDEAAAHTRAVFAVLRDLVSGREFSDMAAQLSRDYEPLLAAAS
jgi:uncharacterized protein (DUF2267 family)